MGVTTKKPWTLDEHLAELERTDPAVAKAAEALRDLPILFDRAKRAAEFREQVKRAKEARDKGGRR